MVYLAKIVQKIAQLGNRGNYIRYFMANLKRTHDDILASILDTVHRKDFNATGLSQLFAVSGTSSSSFYNYFRSKNELGHALIDFEWAQLRTNVLEPAAKYNDPITQVFLILECLESKQLVEPHCGGCLLGKRKFVVPVQNVE